MATAFTESTTQATNGFPQDRSLWHNAAPRRLIDSWAKGDTERRWKVWQRQLARRKRPAEPPFLSGKTPPIMWAWPDHWAREELLAALGSLGDHADSWDLPTEPPRDLPTALRAVALAYALPGLAAGLSSESWWNLAESLRGLALQAQELRVDWPGDAHEVLRQQLLAGELPLALGSLFPEVRPLRALRKPARQALSEALDELCDGRGVPHAQLLSVLAPLWACWTRCRWLGERLKQGCWSRAAERQFEWLVRRAIRLADGAHRLVLCNSEDGPAPVVPKQLFATALQLVGDAGDCAAAAAVLPRSAVPEDADFDDQDLPKTSFHSEWSGLAVLSTGWSNSAPRLAVSYADDPMGIELSANQRPLLSGRWTTVTTCDDRPVQVEGEWDELLWQSDEDCDYLELGVDLSDGLRLERQLLLAREDHVLYLADIVVADGDMPRRLSHSLQLPLAPDVAWLPEAETRDGLLVDSKSRAAVIPPALFEWRSDPRGGNLVCQENRLTLTQEINGRALCCPLLFDLRPRRARSERTWRQLTVAEALAVVPQHVAVGYRIQSGRDQWLLYRSLGPAANRTLLGQNLSSEFFAGRFLKTGEVDEWIEVEASE